MNNWMEKFERSKDAQRERELNTKLEELLDFLDKAYRVKDRVKVIDEIIKIYEKLRVEACEYDEKDYIAKKKELEEIIYKRKMEEHMDSLESQSWNEYKDEEQIEEERE